MIWPPRFAVLWAISAAIAKFQADTAAGIVKPEELEFYDQDEFGAAFGKAGANCKACHKQYRIKKY